MHFAERIGLMTNHRFALIRNYHRHRIEPLRPILQLVDMHKMPGRRCDMTPLPIVNHFFRLGENLLTPRLDLNKNHRRIIQHDQVDLTPIA